MDVKKGDHFIICSDQKEVTYDGNMTVMITTYKYVEQMDKHLFFICFIIMA